MNPTAEKSPFDLSGKTAAVTGASRGIGLGIALGLVNAGAGVVALQRGPLAPELAAAAEKAGVSAAAVHVDLASEESVAAATAETLAGHRSTSWSTTPEPRSGTTRPSSRCPTSTASMAINTRAVFQLCQGFGTPMVERGGGKIINMASLLTFQGGLRVPAYAASKGAVAQLTKALCNEWAPRGVNVNAVAPGYIATDMNEALLADAQRHEQISVRIPAARWGTGGDLAGAVVFLASPAADYIHGVVLPVDGGWLAR